MRYRVEINGETVWSDETDVVDVLHFPAELRERPAERGKTHKLFMQNDGQDETLIAEQAHEDDEVTA